MQTVSLPAYGVPLTKTTGMQSLISLHKTVYGQHIIMHADITWILESQIIK